MEEVHLIPADSSCTRSPMSEQAFAKFKQFQNVFTVVPKLINTPRYFEQTLDVIRI